jgi:hypothetical protein
LKERIEQRAEEKSEFKELVVICYVAELSKAIRRAINEVDFFFCQRHVKENIKSFPAKHNGKEKEVIYEIPCECGTNYLGETGHPLETQVNEHRKSWLKLSKLQEKDISEKNISLLLAAHAAETNTR